jgi:CBS domain-containing protein
MKVKEVMSRGVECTRPEATLQGAAMKMRDLNIGTLPVCGEQNKLVGILTDRDITIRSVALGQNPANSRVREAMTPKVIYCYEDDDAEDAARVLKDHQIRRLVVLDRRQQLVGIMSLGDLAVETKDDKLSGEALERISEPVHPRH